MLSGLRTQLILLGTKGDRLTIDPTELQRRLMSHPMLRDELRSVMVDDLDDLLGTYVASGQTLLRATEGYPPVTDDDPRNEYRSPIELHAPGSIPANFFDVRDMPDWCPGCFDRQRRGQEVDHLLGYMETTSWVFAAARHPGARRGGRVAVGPQGRAAIERSRLPSATSSAREHRSHRGSRSCRLHGTVGWRSAICACIRGFDGLITLPWHCPWFFDFDSPDLPALRRPQKEVRMRQVQDRMASR